MCDKRADVECRDCQECLVDPVVLVRQPGRIRLDAVLEEARVREERQRNAGRSGVPVRVACNDGEGL